MSSGLAWTAGSISSGFPDEMRDHANDNSDAGRGYVGRGYVGRGDVGRLDGSRSPFAVAPEIADLLDYDELVDFSMFPTASAPERAPRHPMAAAPGR